MSFCQFSTSYTVIISTSSKTLNTKLPISLHVTSHLLSSFSTMVTMILWPSQSGFFVFRLDFGRRFFSHSTFAFIRARCSSGAAFSSAISSSLSSLLSGSSSPLLSSLDFSSSALFSYGSVLGSAVRVSRNHLLYRCTNCILVIQSPRCLRTLAHMT